MERRDVLVAIVVSGAVNALNLWAAPQLLTEDLSEEQLRFLLRQLAGLELQASEAPKILASFKSNRFTAKVDPTIQPQSDFDPEVDL